jgi:hypothetical protein
METKIEMIVQCPKCYSVNLKSNFDDTGICLDCGHKDIAKGFVSEKRKENADK